MATYFDPFKELHTLMQSAPRTVAVPMDVYKAGDVYHADIDLPGVDPSSIDIDVEDRTITIRAERKLSAPEGSEWVTRERSGGTYARQLTVGRGLALDEVTGSYTDGVLTLTIPVAEQAKPRKVQVTRGEAGVLEGSTEAEPAKAEAKTAKKAA